MQLSLLFVILSLASLTAGAGEFLREVRQPLGTALIPTGFDNDDSVELMVTGEFPSTCFQLGPVTTEVDLAHRRVTLSATAYEYQGNCWKMKVPFHQVIHLGLLRVAGTYDVVDGNRSRTLGSLEITAAPQDGHGTDTIYYAPLTDAYLTKEAGRDRIVVSGAFPNDCLTVAGVDTISYADVVVALPRVRRIDLTSCREGTYPFTESFAITSRLPLRTFLLHVRSQSGRSINKLVPYPERPYRE